MTGIITKPAHEIRLGDELRLTVEEVHETPGGLVIIYTDSGPVTFRRNDQVRTYRGDD